MVGTDVSGAKVNSVFQAEGSSQLRSAGCKVRDLYKEGVYKLWNGRET